VAQRSEEVLDGIFHLAFRLLGESRDATQNAPTVGDRRIDRAAVFLIPFGTLADLTSTATALSASSLLLPIAGLCLLPLPQFPPLPRDSSPD
jgi:hypothetical protein